jgi:aminopeptidase
VYVTWPDINLHVKIWSDRKRVWGRGVNIPSFEIFTSPDRRGTNGTIKFNQPLYRHGQLITGISLTFKDWIITDFDAKENKELLTEIIRTPNANKVWEFSLTDGRFSHITKFMAETLYDENRGGPEWNTHIAIWNAYVECWTWDVTKITKKDMKDYWFNESVEHVDIVSTAPRKVVATLPDGSTKVIYEHGKFTL